MTSLLRRLPAPIPARIRSLPLPRPLPLMLPLLLSALLAFLPAAADAARRPAEPPPPPPLAAQPPGHAIASAHPLATQAGFEMLARGGTAFDAAVAISATLAVVEPAGSGLGGGGFWLLHRQFDNLDVMVDGREIAPYAATGDMYLSRTLEPDPKLSRDGGLSAGIPGHPAALVHIQKAFCTLPLQVLLEPAIRHAREGFPIDPVLARRIAESASRFSPAARQIFLMADGTAPQAGAILQQPDLARTLELIAQYGNNGFYDGETAQELVAGVQGTGGIWALEDLKRYFVAERQPLVFNYRGFRITTAPPPSAGGVALAQVLGMLEQLNWPPADPVLARHQVIEALRRAFRDRAMFLGDPDFVPMDLDALASQSYLQSLAQGIGERATPSASLPMPAAAAREGGQTTHFSVIDGWGNRVAATMSINLWFGSGVVAPGTGVVLNNEMDDFATKPLAPNAFGLVHTKSNAIAPGKRMLSSMTPTFIEGPDGVAILGTPGGSRIVSMVLQGVLAHTFGYPAESIVRLGRYHHQYLPDVVQYEPGALSDAELAGLAAKGHALRALNGYYGNMQVVIWDRRRNQLQAASDPREYGGAGVVEAKVDLPLPMTAPAPLPPEVEPVRDAEPAAAAPVIAPEEPPAPESAPAAEAAPEAAPAPVE